MVRDYAHLPPAQVRRADRAVDDDTWIVGLLQRAPVGYLATVHDGQPYLNSNLYVYDAAAHVIYMHTARTGRTRANVEMDERVCFTVTEMGRLLPADEALEFSVEYSSVVIFGSARLLSADADRERARHGLQLLLDRYAPHLRPGRDYRPITDDELARTAVYEIAIREWSGKRKQVADDFPGAFWYADGQSSGG